MIVMPQISTFVFPHFACDKLYKQTEKYKNSYFLMSVASLFTPCFVMFCLFLYGPFCHGAHNLTGPHCLQHFFFKYLFHLY